MKDIIEHDPGLGFTEKQQNQISELFEGLWKKVANPDIKQIITDANRTETVDRIRAAMWPFKVNNTEHFALPYIAVSAFAISIVTLIILIINHGTY